MQNEMNLMRQMVDVLVESATHKKDYGRELETLDDVARAISLETINAGDGDDVMPSPI